MFATYVLFYPDKEEWMGIGKRNGVGVWIAMLNGWMDRHE